MLNYYVNPIMGLRSTHIDIIRRFVKPQGACTLIEKHFKLFKLFPKLTAQTIFFRGNLDNMLHRLDARLKKCTLVFFPTLYTTPKSICENDLKKMKIKS